MCTEKRDHTAPKLLILQHSFPQTLPKFPGSYKRLRTVGNGPKFIPPKIGISKSLSEKSRPFLQNPVASEPTRARRCHWHPCSPAQRGCQPPLEGQPRGHQAGDGDQGPRRRSQQQDAQRSNWQCNSGSIARMEGPTGRMRERRRWSQGAQKSQDVGKRATDSRAPPRKDGGPAEKCQPGKEHAGEGPEG